MERQLPWLKVWTDMLDDPKLNGRDMSDTDRWLWVCLLMVARDYGLDGLIPVDIDALAWRLRRTVQELEKSINKYMGAGIVTMDEAGNIIIPKFSSRQAVKPSDNKAAIRERVAKHRAQTLAQDPITDVTPRNALQLIGTKQGQNGDVTPRNAPVTRYNSESNAFVTPANRIDKEKDKRENKNKSKNAGARPATKYATPVDDPFEITDEVLAWASKKGYEVDHEGLEEIAEEFVNHHKAKGTRYIDWQAAFKNWVNRDIGKGWGNPRGGASTGNGHGPRHVSKRADFGSPYGGTIEIRGEI